MKRGLRQWGGLLAAGICLCAGAAERSGTTALSSHDLAEWQHFWGGMTTQQTRRIVLEKLAVGFLRPLKAEGVVSTLPQQGLQLMVTGAFAYSVVVTNRQVWLTFPGQAWRERRALRAGEEAAADFLGLPLRESWTNYHVIGRSEKGVPCTEMFLKPERLLFYRQHLFEFPFYAVYRQIWFDTHQQKVLKTYWRTVSGEETTVEFP